MRQPSKKYQFEEETLGATASVASFIVDLGFQDLPHEAVQQAKQLILDYFGVTLAASTSPIAQILKEYLSETGGKPQATIIGLPLKVPCPDAAWANGTLGHALDFDDASIKLPAAIHPTVDTLPAALSVGEAFNVGGRDVLTAFILGIEVASKIDRSMRGSAEKGWHGTGTFGTLAATAASGKMLKLTVEEMEHAIGVAASAAGGLTSNFGTMTKPFHAGQASRNGVVAALLAKKGFTSSKNILEKHRGFGQVFGRGLDEKYVKENLGKPWEILDPGIHIKPYPSCAITHAAIEITLKLARERNITPEQVDLVEVRWEYGKVDLRGHFFRKPRTGLEAKFSLEFCIAIALLEGKATLDEFTDTRASEHQVQQMIERIRIVPSKEESEGSYKEIASLKTPLKTSVKIRMKNGKEYGELVEFPRGFGRKNPLTTEELETKFRSCSKYALPPEMVDEIIRAISNLENVKIHQLMSLLHP
jgi:2-methylcitrate dehydratase PrpD